MGKAQIKITNQPGQSWKSVLEDTNIVASNKYDHFTSDSLDGVVEELYNRTDIKYINYESTIASTTHTIMHNFASYNLQIDVLVEDPDDLSWNRDLVSINYINENQILITLSEACNIKVIVKKFSN